MLHIPRPVSELLYHDTLLNYIKKALTVEWTAIILRFKTETPFKQDQLVFH